MVIYCKKAVAEDEKGRSPDRELPIEDYDLLTVDQVTAKLDGLSKQEIKKLKAYEEKHRDRKTLVDAINRRLERA